MGPQGDKLDSRMLITDGKLYKTADTIKGNDYEIHRGKPKASYSILFVFSEDKCYIITDTPYCSLISKMIESSRMNA